MSGSVNPSNPRDMSDSAGAAELIKGVRVRFAPSPTGKLHVGSARTALFNWFFAKHHSGTFILRIEDTDQKRSDSAFLKDIYASLAFLGIQADEGPIFQSQRLAIYQEYAQKLLDAKLAVKEENGGIVFKVPFKQVTFQDLLHGPITVDTSMFEDLVLMKSDGLPTYNFACVVDDALMKITHIIRGDDHIANTPKQIVLYEALNFQVPVFCHIPLIVGADRSRLSKRHGATSVDEYRQVGYLADAFVNYLALLGWSPGGNREMMPPQEIIQIFDLSRVRKTAAFFDQRKLDWLNGQYLKQLSAKDLARAIAERLIEKGVLAKGYDHAWLERITAAIHGRIRVLSDVEKENAFFFEEPPAYDEAAVNEHLRQEGAVARLNLLRERLSALADFEPATLETTVRGLMAELSLEPKQFVHPVRVALTGRSVSPPLYETMAILGREKVLRRLEDAVKRASSPAGNVL